MTEFKPAEYNSLSAYLIADEARQLADMLIAIFDAEEKRCYLRPDGKIMHMELKIDDTILMISNSTDEYKATTSMLHLYVPNVHDTYTKALAHGAKGIDKPENKPGDPDTRGAFLDMAGNYWAVSTQLTAPTY